MAPFKSRLSLSREAEILEAALGIVSENGYEATTIDALAARVGSSKTTLYRRWSNKSELIVAALQRRVATALWFPDQGTFRADVLTALHVLRTWLTNDGDVLRTLIEAGHRDPFVRTEVDRQLAQPHNAMWEECVIERAQERGEIREDVDVSWLNELCEGALFSRLLLLREPVTDAYLQRLVDEVVLPLFAPSVS